MAWRMQVATSTFHPRYSFIKGALTTIGRPYGPILNLLHHGIGRTHVAHHVASNIPHYEAWKATSALAANFPDHYLYDPTPIHLALWRVASKCVAVEKLPGSKGAYVFTSG